MAEMIGVRPRSITIDQLIRQEGRTAKVPDGVGRLRIRDAGINTIYLEGRLDGMAVREELCFDRGMGVKGVLSKVTYHSGTVFDHDTVNLRLLKALEAVAVARNMHEFVIRDKSYGMGGTDLTEQMAQVLSAVGYTKSNYHRGVFKDLTSPSHP